MEPESQRQTGPTNSSFVPNLPSAEFHKGNSETEKQEADSQRATALGLVVNKEIGR